MHFKPLRDIMDINNAFIFRKMILSSVLGREEFHNDVILSFKLLKNLSTILLVIGMSLRSMYVLFKAILCHLRNLQQCINALAY